MNKKQENVLNMIKTFGEMLRDMPDGKLREEFNKFVYTLTMGNKPLPDILAMMEKQIEQASSVLHKDMQTNAKATVKFWKTIRDMIVNTYKENQDESR